MHKIFAKTLFLGKNLIFLPQCHSTNEETKRFSKSGHFPEGSVIWTDFQEKGRGQQGNIWVSEAGKNLLFTIFLKPKMMVPADQFKLTIMSSLAIQHVLQSMIPDKKIEIKWPNDIYCQNKKICGILIETTISKGYFDQVFCGIGLNVNQSHFALPNATSLAMETGQTWNRTEIMELILLELESLLSQSDQESKLMRAYNSVLRWKNEIRMFSVEGQVRSGEIIEVSPNGELVVSFDGILKFFKLKEISFIR